MQEHGLVRANLPGQLSTFSTVNEESNIDVTLATPTAYDRVDEWQVHEAWTTSDHRAISFRYNSGRSLVRADLSSDRFNISGANRVEFDSCVLRELNRERQLELAGKTPEQQVTELQEVLLGACGLSMRRRRRGLRSVPWWSSKLTMARCRYIESRKDFQVARRLGLNENEVGAAKA